MKTTPTQNILEPRQRCIGIVGAGVVGTALGVALKRCGYSIAGVMDPSEQAAKTAAEQVGGVLWTTNASELARQSNCIFITTPDDAIAEVCEVLSREGGFSEGDLVLHCSGALTADALNSAREYGAFAGCMHPMGVFADVNVAVSHLSELFFCLEGDVEAVEAAELMVKDIGATPIRVPKELKILTHVAACLTSNYVVTLADLGVGVLEPLRMSDEERIQLVLPLFRGAIRALETQGLPEALTGPIARGDVSTVRRHIEALGSYPDFTRLYALLGLRTLSVAEKKGGADKKALRRMKAILSECLENARRC